MPTGVSLEQYAKWCLDYVAKKAEIENAIRPCIGIDTTYYCLTVNGQNKQSLSAKDHLNVIFKHCANSTAYPLHWTSGLIATSINMLDYMLDECKTGYLFVVKALADGNFVNQIVLNQGTTFESLAIEMELHRWCSKC